MDTSLLLAAARGEQPADLLLRTGRIVNVFAGLVEQGDVAIWRDRIVGIGPGYKALISKAACWCRRSLPLPSFPTV
jgi:adenine deaminase